MTENTMPPPLAADDEQPVWRRKPGIVAGGAVAVVGLLGTGYLLLGGGGADTALDTPLPGVVRAAPVVTKPVTAVKTSARKPSVLPPTSSVPLGRDPFLPLYVVPVAAVTGGSAAGTGTTTGSVGATPAPFPVAAPAGTAAGKSYAVQLVAVKTGLSGDKTFVFAYGGARKSVIAAQRFGSYGELVTLKAVKDARGTVTGALLQVGDDDPVTISIGEKLTVK